MNVAEYEASFRAMQERARFHREQAAVANLRQFFAAEAAAHAGLEMGSEPCDRGGTYVFPKSRQTARPERVTDGPRVVAATLRDDERREGWVKPGSVEFAPCGPLEAAAERASKNMQQRHRWAWWLEGVENHATAPERPAADLAKIRERNAVMWGQTMTLARRMADSGAAMFPMNRLQIGIFDPLADTVEMLPGVRRINFLAAVAAQRRADQLIFAEYFLSHTAPDRIELHTFTAGKRLRTGLLRRGMKAISKKLGELTRQRWYKRVAEMVWRGEELGGLTLGPKSAADYNRRHGIPEQVKAIGLDGAVRWVDNPAAHRAGMLNPEAWRERAGAAGRDPLWHVHAHCLVVFHVGVTEAQKREFWAKCRKFWGRVCDRGEREDGTCHVKNLREAIKYPCKPADLDLLSGGQLIDVCDAVSRLKIVLPRAGLRRFRAGCRRSVEKPARRFDRSGASVLVLGPDHNSKRSPVVLACSLRAPEPVGVRLLRSALGREQTDAGCWVDPVTGRPVERKRTDKNRAPVEFCGPVQPGENEVAFRLGWTVRGPVETDPLAVRMAARIASTPMPDRSTDTAKATDTEPAKPVTNRILAKFCGPDARPRFVVFNPVDRSQLAGRAQVSRTVRAFTRARDAHATRHAPAPTRLKGVHNRHSTCTPAAGFGAPGVVPDPQPPPTPAERLRKWAEIAA